VVNPIADVVAFYAGGGLHKTSSYTRSQDTSRLLSDCVAIPDRTPQVR
jgi:hypothetical protein